MMPRIDWSGLRDHSNGSAGFGLSRSPRAGVSANHLRIQMPIRLFIFGDGYLQVLGPYFFPYIYIYYMQLDVSEIGGHRWAFLKFESQRDVTTGCSSEKVLVEEDEDEDAADPKPGPTGQEQFPSFRHELGY